MQSRSLTIGAVRGIAIILVVYGHVIQRTMAANNADFFLNPAFKIIYTFHMPLFFFISGYLMALSLSRKSIGDTFKARCKTLLIPFISWGILGIIADHVFHTTGAGAIWFLFALFISSCLLLCSIQLEKRFTAAIFAVVYFLLLLIPYNEHFFLYYIKWFYLFYAGGYLVNKYGIKITDKPINRAAPFIALLLFMALASFWTTSDYIYINRMGFALDRLAYRYIVGFLGIAIVFTVGAYCSRTKIGHALDRIGIYSLDIYLIQRYVVEGIYPRLVQHLHMNFDFNAPFFLYFFAPLAALLFTGLCIVISKLLIRRSAVLNRLLLGGRV